MPWRRRAGRAKVASGRRLRRGSRTLASGEPMSILRRLATVVRSNLAALGGEDLDPAARVDGWIAQLERAVREGRQEQVRLRAEAKQRAQRAEEAEAEAARWEERAALALREEDETLARDALRQKLRAERRAQALRRDAQALQQAERKAAELVERAEARLREVRERRGTLVAQLRGAGGPGSTGTAALERAVSPLHAVEDQVDRAEAELEVEALLDDGTAELEARFATLHERSEGQDLDDEVAALKARLRRET